MNKIAAAKIPNDEIRYERDRFVAFAFAAADVFIETDHRLNILYATGALRWLLGKNCKEPKGQKLGSFLTKKSAKLIDATCLLAKREGRFAALPMSIQQTGGRVIKTDVCGTYLPSGRGTFFFAFRGRTSALAAFTAGNVEQPITEPKKFAANASEIAKAAEQAGEDVSLTMLNLSGLSELKRKLSPDAANELLSDIQAQLESCSLGGAITAQVDEENIGLLHQGNLNIEGLASGISEQALNYDENGEGIHVRAQTIDVSGTELSEADLAKAVIYAIQKFTESGGEYTIADLTKGYRENIEATGIRIAEIKSVIKLRAFDLAFQPIVDLSDRRIHHHEALVRFRGKDAGASPYETITFAEDVGLISALDIAICERAVDTVKKAAAAGNGLSVAINVSGRSLETPAFLDRLQAILKTCGAIRERIMFEVTESSKISKLEETNNYLQTVRSLGHKVCLDDFGAGASAFQYLRALNVDIVKIDGSYVQDISGNPDRQAFVRSMTSLCRDLNIETIAEMVTDEATVDILRHEGVDFGQGYLFGKPVIGLPA